MESKWNIMVFSSEEVEFFSNDGQTTSTNMSQNFQTIFSQVPHCFHNSGRSSELSHDDV